MKNKFNIKKEEIMAIICTSVAIILFMIIMPTAVITTGTTKINNDEKDKSVMSNVSANSEIKFTGDEKISVYITSKGVIEEMSVEDYVCGVVANEMPAEFNIEALKAQAVASRTYLASKAVNKCVNGHGADICDSVHCQVYTSKENRMDKWQEDKAEEYWEKIERAVKETEGQVISYNRELAMYPQFFATSSGRTENSEDANWGSIPYLKSVVSEGEEVAPKYTSEKSMPLGEFVNSINIKYPEANVDLNNIDNEISVLSRSEAGGVKNLMVGNKEVKGSDFRFLVGLNSTNFTYVIKENEIVFDCKGYGHGVGMSQWGANAMAKNGGSYDEIIKHYYSGVDISTLKYE